MIEYFITNPFEKNINILAETSKQISSKKQVFEVNYILSFKTECRKKY